MIQLLTALERINPSIAGLGDLGYALNQRCFYSKNVSASDSCLAAKGSKLLTNRAPPGWAIWIIRPFLRRK